MELETYTDADIALTEALECDPAVMRDLGGPVPKDQLPEIHRRRLEYIEKGAWYLKIVPEPGAAPVGTVGLWEPEPGVHEMCWMVLPEHQGRGYATAAVREMLARIRSEGKIKEVRAFTSTKNIASNKICRKLKFSNVGVVDVEYAGRPLHCNHWIWRSS